MKSVCVTDYKINNQIMGGIYIDEGKLKLDTDIKLYYRKERKKEVHKL